MVFFINKILKCFFLNMFSIAIFYKINNKKCKKIHMFISFIYSLLLAFFYAMIRNYIDMIGAIILNAFFISILLKFLTKQRLSKVIIGIAISNSTAYVLYAIAATIEYPIQMLFRIYSRTLNGLILFFIESILVMTSMKARKLKNGLQFLQNSNEYIETLLINIAMFIIVMYSIVGMSKLIDIPALYVYFIIICICMIASISKVIQMYYKRKLTDDTISGLKEEINSKDIEIQRLTEENYKIHKVNHEFYNKQKALEKKVKDYIDSVSTESADEIGLLDRVNELSKEHSSSMYSIKAMDNLPKTEIAEIDDMFSYLNSECVDNNIDFSLRIYGNIFYMINNLISRNKLETLIGDHVRDAIIAINSSDSKNKKILVLIGKSNDYYELSIYDTGIEFEIDTLNKLGEKQVTTHKDEGGSGMGFMTTFETMKECKASIEIEEIGKKSVSNYTKAVKFVFDKKGEYSIKSYRKPLLENKLNTCRIKIKE